MWKIPAFRLLNIRFHDIALPLKALVVIAIPRTFQRQLSLGLHCLFMFIILEAPNRNLRMFSLPMMHYHCTYKGIVMFTQKLP